MILESFVGKESPGRVKVLSEPLLGKGIERVDTKICSDGALPDCYPRIHFSVEVPEGYQRDVIISTSKTDDFLETYRPTIFVLPHDLRGKSLAVFYTPEKRIIGVLPTPGASRK